jgi:hypothetical protein
MKTVEEMRQEIVEFHLENAANFLRSAEIARGAADDAKCLSDSAVGPLYLKMMRIKREWAGFKAECAIDRANERAKK